MSLLFYYYVQLHNITSVIGKTKSSLRSFIDINNIGTRINKDGEEEDDYSLNISAQVFEDLSKLYFLSFS